ncbi:MAG: ATP-binding protein [Methanocellales archaeon]|nr:ATP-binding protein [Methanocellales archaeon]
MSGDESLDICELLLTAQIYNESQELNEDDIPPNIRKHYWNKKEKGVKRPISVSESDVESIYGIKNARRCVTSLPFVEFEDFGERLRMTVFDLGAKWLERHGVDRIQKNPVLAYYYENNDMSISYSQAKMANRPKEVDREWIDSLINEVVEEGEDARDVLKLVHIVAPEEVKQTLNEIVLTKEQEGKISKIVKAIEYRDYLQQIGLREIGKLLFVGPPGTGKTSTARALSERLKLPFLEVKLSMTVSHFLGETSKNVDKVFELAKRLSPCILFIDEFDFVAKTRTSDEHAALKRAVNTLLKCIDEISLVNDGVLLIGATNHPKLLDNAVWRRFDEIVMFPLPDKVMRQEILTKILASIEGSIDAADIAQRTDGYTGSDLRLLLREAVLNALIEERTTLTHEDLVKAVDAFKDRTDMKIMEGHE